MIDGSDEEIDSFADIPPADISFAEFEAWVAETLRAIEPLVEDLRIEPHETIGAPDGDYDFDVTIRFEFMGLSYLTIVEAKKHKNPIKRELVQVLHQKLASTGAQKAVMISTAPYQNGAIRFAMTHGIALLVVTEGRFTYIAHSRDSQPMTRDQALNAFGLPVFAGWHFAPHEDAIMRSVVSADIPDRVLEMLIPGGINGLINEYR